MWLRKYKKRIISWLIVLAILFYLANKLIDNWHNIRNYSFHFNYFYLVLSCIFWALGIAWLGVSWKKIAHMLQKNNDLSWREAIKLSFYSWAGRYVPGKIAQIFGLTSFSKTKDLSRENLWLSSVFQVLFSVIAMALTALFLLAIFGIDYFGWEIFFLFLAMNIASLFVVFYPRIFDFFVKMFFRLILRKKDTLIPSFSAKQKIFVLSHLSLAPIFRALGFFFLVRSIFFLPLRDLGVVCGIFTFSITAGTLALFAPAGLGVKETFLVLGMQKFFPLEVAILISLLTMFWSLALDLGFLGLAFLSDKIKFKRK